MLADFEVVWQQIAFSSDLAPIRAKLSLCTNGVGRDAVPSFEVRLRPDNIMFRSYLFSCLVFWSLLATKLRKYYVIFVYILQGKMGKTEKNGKKIMQQK